MVIVKDKEKEEKEKEVKEKVEESKISWFHKVPTLWKIGGIAILFIRFQAVSQAKGDISEMWIWVLGVLAAWYFIGTEGKRRTTQVLSPEEAEDALEAEIQRKVNKGQISRWAKIFIGPNNGIFWHEGMPQHYQIGLQIIDNDRRSYKKGIVIAEGTAKGYATIQNNPGELQGTEMIPVRTPPIFKQLKKYGVDVDQFIFGKK